MRLKTLLYTLCLRRYRAVSFDIFDTLLERDVDRPVDVFLRVGDIIFMPTIERPDVDGEALRQLSAIYGCKVVPVPFLSVVKANGKYGGGALNCVSWTVRQ